MARDKQADVVSASLRALSSTRPPRLKGMEQRIALLASRTIKALAVLQKVAHL